MAREINVYDASGKQNNSLSLAVDLVEKETSSTTYSTAVRVLLQNWRQGTVGCKTRGELSFSNKKPWRQKGTGRARVGSIRSPLWRKGGVIFGPQPRVRELAINKEQKKLVFNNLFFDMLKNEKIYCLDVQFDAKPSTKKAVELLNNVHLVNKKVLVFLSAHDDVAYASFRNIPHVNIVYFDHRYSRFAKPAGELVGPIHERWLPYSNTFALQVPLRELYKKLRIR